MQQCILTPITLFYNDAATHVGISCVLLMTISTVDVVPAAEDHKEGPHTLEQQRGPVVTQV